MAVSLLCRSKGRTIYGHPQDTPVFRKASLETERKFVSKVILESNVTPNITRSSDSFRTTVVLIVNGRDWGRIVRDLENILVFFLLAFNFIPQRSLQSLTLPRSRIINSATVTLMPGKAQQTSKWSHQHNRSAYFPDCEKPTKCTGGTITGPKH